MISLDCIKKPSFILYLILLIFLLKGVFLVALFPIFSGQDESRHYNTVQFFLEPEEKNWDIKKGEYSDIEKGEFSTYNYSQEIRGTARVVEDNTIKSVPYDVISFGNNYDGKGENEINSNNWMPYNDIYPMDIVGGRSLYHKLASFIEKYFIEESILVRFFSIRIFSVILGLIVIALSYFVAKNIGLSEKNSLILAGIISFQPRLSIYFTNINYDVLLIPAFALFTLGGVLAIRNGIGWKSFITMASAVLIAAFAKLTGLILLVVFIFLVVFLIFQKFKHIKNENDRKKQIFIAVSLLILIILILFLNWGTFLKIFKFENLNLREYLTDSLGVGRILLTSNAYWGNLGWEDNLVSRNFIRIIWSIELASLIGLAIFLKRKNNPIFLPDKKYIIFFIVMMVFLQLGIRFADLKVFTNTGSLDLGAPGRYFLPNIISHIILVFVGLGTILRKKEYFEKSLLIGMILMISFCFYLIFNIIIPRYYL